MVRKLLNSLCFIHASANLVVADKQSMKRAKEEERIVVTAKQEPIC